MERIKDYFENKAISQSKIKAIRKGTHLLRIIEKNPKYFVEKEGMLIGSLVDDMFTYKEIRDKYYLTSVEKPSETIVSILREVYEESLTSIFGVLDDDLLKAAKNHNYGNNKYSDERILKELSKHDYYLTELSKMEGKTMISPEEFKLAEKIFENLKGHEYTRWLFEMDYRVQVPLYFNEDGLEFKALLDYVGYKDKILYIGDFKMTEYNNFFEKPFERFDYDIQAYHYTKAVHKSMDKLELLFGPIEIIMPFMFITESYKAPGLPLIYEITPESMKIGEDKWKEGVELYKWHKENDIWDIDRVFYESKGILKI